MNVIQFSPAVTQKVVIWDLGDTLLTPDTFGLARKIGITDFILYPLLDWKNPSKIQDLVFDVLHSLEHQNFTLPVTKTAQGKVLPAVMCNWLAGKQKGQEIYYKASQRIQQLDQMGYFTSSRQKRLIKSTLKVMFDPLKLAQHMQPIKEGMRLLHDCAQQGHKLFILSNWDTDSFNYLAATQQGKKLLSYFEPDHVIISGALGLIKPSPLIFKHIITKFNLSPHNCVVIDDQPENIQVANQCGMTGLLLKNHNYEKLKQELQKLNII